MEFWRKGLLLTSVLAVLAGGTRSLEVKGLRAEESECLLEDKLDFARKALKEEFGFDFNGLGINIEDPERHVAEVADALYRESLERPFFLSEFVFEGKEPHEKTAEQRDNQRKLQYKGLYEVFWDRVTVVEMCRDFKGTVHHEVKHDKTWDVVAEDSTFLDRWRKLSQDKNGHSMYYTPDVWNVVKKYSLGYNAVDAELGFVTRYARKNVREDIAELGRRAEDFGSASMFAGWLGFRDEPRNERITGKVVLAQEKRIIPPEFSEWIRLRNLYSRSIDSRGCCIEDMDAALSFLDESEDFIEKNSNSIYIGELHDGRFHILRERDSPNLECPYDLVSKEQLKFQARFARNFAFTLDRELMGVLQAPYVKPFTYNFALVCLEYINEDRGQNETARIFEQAQEVYRERVANFDVSLPKRRVNDFLIENGVME